MTRHAALLLALFPALALADEGMWTFDAFPSEKVGAVHGFAPPAAWLDRVRLASVRLARGCSGSFVSPRGLVLTNHHCVHSCVEQLSSAGRDLVRDGFLARTAAEELRCPDVEVNQLLRISDVTARVRKATDGLAGAAYQKALRGAKAVLERECQTSDAVRCDVVTLFQGGLHHLYTYRRWQDVRLVFAPELAIAFFGGDPDNFNFPRYDLDAAFLRVWEGGKPLASRDFLAWSPTGPAAGELTFVTGHPGGTDRALTTSELRHERDFALPERLVRLAELRGLLTGFQLLGEEQKRISTARLFYAENSFKALSGGLAALREEALLAAKAEAEEALRRESAKDPERGPRVAAALASVEAAQVRRLELRTELTALEHGLDGELFSIARTLLRGAAERARADEDRLREFRESNLPALTQRLFRKAPIHPELERLLLGHSLEKAREALGTGHAAVRALLGPESPAEAAARAVAGTKLADPEERRRLWDGGAAAVDASDDPMIALARAADPAARAVRKAFEDEVEAAVRKGHEALAEARFALRGRSDYPDATFTLRLSYGTVKGWAEGSREIPPFTTIGGAFDRHTGRDPFALPASWLGARDRLDLSTPFNFVTTNDIIGGNSGSPVVNRDARLVGLVFDGNIHSLGGDYWFDERLNRAVAVHSSAIVEALSKVYGATELLAELRPPAKGERRR